MKMQGLKISFKGERSQNINSTNTNQGAYAAYIPNNLIDNGDQFTLNIENLEMDKDDYAYLSDILNNALPMIEKLCKYAIDCDNKKQEDITDTNNVCIKNVFSDNERIQKVYESLSSDEKLTMYQDERLLTCKELKVHMPQIYSKYEKDNLLRNAIIRQIITSDNEVKEYIKFKMDSEYAKKNTMEEAFIESDELGIEISCNINNIDTLIRNSLIRQYMAL